MQRTFTGWALLGQEVPTTLSSFEQYFVVPTQSQIIFVIGTQPDGQIHCSGEIIYVDGIREVRAGRNDYTLDGPPGDPYAAFYREKVGEPMDPDAPLSQAGLLE